MGYSSQHNSDKLIELVEDALTLFHQYLSKYPTIDEAKSRTLADLNLANLKPEDLFKKEY